MARKNTEGINPTIIKQFIDLQKAYQRSVCLIPGCKNKNIIKAHTIQKNGGIREISEEGKVLTFNDDSALIWKILGMKQFLDTGIYPFCNNPSWPEPSSICINKASTVTGFCGQHDREVFADIEGQEDIVPTSKQVMLFTLRSFAYEIFKKLGSSSKKTNEILKRGLLEGELKELIDLHTEGSIQGLNQSIKIFNQLYSSLSVDNCLPLSYVLFEFDELPEVVCSFSRFVDLDLNPMKIIKKVEINDFQWIACTCFCKKSKGYVIFSWDRRQNDPKEFMNTLLSKQKNTIPDYLVELFFLLSENVYFSPIWWNSLKVSSKIYIEKCIIDLMPDIKSIMSKRPLHLVDWQITNITSSGL